MRSIVLAVLLAGPVAAAPAPDKTFAPLWLYQGAWHVTRSNAAAGSKPDELVNQCALLGKYFACQQAVNGKPAALLVFVPASEPSHFYTQTINPDGRAAGRGELEIAGDRWIFSSVWDQGGKTTYYRTTNVFSGKDRIHFEHAESSDRQNFKVTDSGDDVRLSARGPR